jgi:hypothetical protein
VLLRVFSQPARDDFSDRLLGWNLSRLGAALPPLLHEAQLVVPALLSLADQTLDLLHLAEGSRIGLSPHISGAVAHGLQAQRQNGLSLGVTCKKGLGQPLSAFVGLAVFVPRHQQANQTLDGGPL